MGAVAPSGELLGITECAEHYIMLKQGSNPAYVNACKLTHSQREIVQQLTDDMLQQGVIQKSNFRWKSPLSLVPKRDGTFRPVIDFRRVN